MFTNKRYVTRGISERIPVDMQLILWSFIDSLESEKDYLQVFELSEDNGNQKIVHTQEQPQYEKEYSFKTNAPLLYARIFVIDDEDHSTMLLAEEY